MTARNRETVRLEHWLDNPPIVLKSQRSRFVPFCCFCIIFVLGFLFLTFRRESAGAFGWGPAYGLIGLFLCSALVCAKAIIWPMRLEISPSGISYTNVVRKHRYYWPDIEKIRLVKGHWINNRGHVPDRIAIEVRPGSHSSTAKIAAEIFWTISAGELLILLTAALTRWGGAGHSGRETL